MHTKETALTVVAAMKAKHEGDSARYNALAALWRDKEKVSIDRFFEQCFFDTLARDPQMASSLGLFELFGVKGHNAFLTDVSVAAWQQLFDKARENLAVLQKYAYDFLTPEQKKSYLVHAWELQHKVNGGHFLFHHYPVNQMFGALFDLNFLLTQVHGITSVEDAEQYITRLERIQVQLTQLTDFMAYQKELGILPPKFALEKVMASIERMLPEYVTEHVFYKHVAQSVLVDHVVLDRVAHVLRTQVYPAYRAVQAYCALLLRDGAENNGVWALPRGDEYYAYILRQHTTTDLTPEEIHELGRAEVQKIQEEIRALLAQEGIVDATRHVVELCKERGSDARFFYPETDAGRAQCMADFEAILARCRKELYPLFDVKPQAPVSMHQVPVHEAEGAPSAYYFPPNADGSRPGMFFVNTRSMAEMPTYRMETLAVHEAEPGHHFQISVQQEIDLPLFRKFTEGNWYTAYIEGWALYTEKLAYEQGFYSSNWSKIGHLQDELMRAVRLVVDTGIHKKRWTREQAIDYMVRELGMHHDSVVTEIERYFVLPGQACSYKVGQLKLLALRKKMQDALGEKFDIREFHNVVLKLGAAPLTVLEQVINEYVQENRLT